jgi:hypothetical protein
MENPKQQEIAPSITSIIRKISDDKALVLFNSIATSFSYNDRSIPLKEMNLSTKQYYSRMSGLLNAGLVKRHKGKYFLTLLGKVVHESQMIIGKTLSYYWKLKIIESIERSAETDLPEEEKTQLIDALIDNDHIKNILLKSVSNPSIESHSMVQTPTAVVEQPQDI